MNKETESDLDGCRDEDPEVVEKCQTVLHVLLCVQVTANPAAERDERVRTGM